MVSAIDSVPISIVLLNDREICYGGTPAALVADEHSDPVWVARGSEAALPEGHTLTGVRRLDDGTVEIRGVGRPVPPGSVPVRATLEDRYLRMTDEMRGSSPRAGGGGPG